MSTLYGDLATLTAKPRTLNVAGRAYKIHPLKISDLGELQNWVNEQLPDPIDACVSSPGYAKLPPEEKKYLLRVGAELAARGKRKLGSPEATELINSVDGVREMLFLSIKDGDPSFTRDDAAKVASRLTPNDINMAFSVAFGVDTAEMISDEGNPDPKAGKESGIGGGSSTTWPTNRSAGVPKRSGG